MTAPTYDWVCQKCLESNTAHTERCVACGFSASYTVADLPVVASADIPDAGPDTKMDDLWRAIWIFFPEAIPAVMVAFYAPMWAMELFGKGDALPGLALVIGEVACVYGFVQGCKRSSKPIAYISMMVLLLIAYIVDSAGY